MLVRLREAQTKLVKFRTSSQIRGVLNYLCFFDNIVYTKTSKNAVKHIILSFKMKGGVISDHFFKMKGDVISDHFLILWFQKDSLDTVGFKTFSGGSTVLHQKVTFGVLNVPMEGGSPVWD